MASKFRIAPDVRYRIIGDEAVVVRQAHGDVLVLNEVAARVLQLVGQGLLGSEITLQIAEEYEAPEPDICSDVEAFLSELEGLEIVESLDNGGDAR
jgi:hypothetical protein